MHTFHKENEEKGRYRNYNKDLLEDLYIVHTYEIPDNALVPWPFPVYRKTILTFQTSAYVKLLKMNAYT